MHEDDLQNLPKYQQKYTYNFKNSNATQTYKVGDDILNFRPKVKRNSKKERNTDLVEEADGGMELAVREKEVHVIVQVQGHHLLPRSHFQARVVALNLHFHRCFYASVWENKNNERARTVLILEGGVESSS